MFIADIGALFSIRGPRDASALLDIERAFNKLEKVALTRRKKIGRPLVLVCAAHTSRVSTFRLMFFGRLSTTCTC